MSYQTDDLRIREITEVVSPEKVHAEIPVSENARRTIFKTRQAIQIGRAHV